MDTLEGGTGDAATAHDLAWLLDHPPMLFGPTWTAIQAFATTHPLPQLDPSTIQPRDLAQRGKRIRLGQYFESLVEVLIQACVQPEIMLRSVKLVTADKRQGELDFLYLADGQWVHLEVAAKFFLGVEHKDSSFSGWLGPGQRDTLTHKLHHLQLVQGPRLQDALFFEALVAVLEAHELPCIPDSVRSEILLHGMLFRPDQGTCPALVAGIQAPQFGVWMPQGRFLAALDAGELHLRGRLEKPHWFATRTLAWADSETPLSFPILCEVASKTKGPTRIFVVPDAWPDRPPRVSNGVGEP